LLTALEPGAELPRKMPAEYAAAMILPVPIVQEL